MRDVDECFVLDDFLELCLRLHGDVSANCDPSEDMLSFLAYPEPKLSSTWVLRADIVSPIFQVGKCHVGNCT